jgi:hypothetical protein
MGTIGSWIGETFDASASEDDLIASRSLNITRITNIVGPLVAGVAAGVGELAEKEPFNEAGFQRQMVLVLLVVVAVVTVADIFGRAITAARAAAPASAVLPHRIKAEKDVPGNPRNVGGLVVAFRTSNSLGPAGDGEYLFVTDDGEATWEKASSLAVVSSDDG